MKAKKIVSTIAYATVFMVSMTVSSLIFVDTGAKDAVTGTATVLSVEKVSQTETMEPHCLVAFDLEGDRVEIQEPMSACNRYAVGQKVSF